jgi:hypothetical protein
MNGLTWTPGYTRGGIRFLGGATSPVDRSHPQLAQFHEHECRVIRCQSQCAKYGLTIAMKNVGQYMAQ